MLLKKLFISKVRIRILEKYLLNPSISFHVRGLVRELNEEINAVRRELINLEAIGLLKSKRDKNKLVYKLNRECTSIPELQTLFLKNSKLGQKILERVQNIEGLESLIVTESFLTETYLSENDIDMLFLGNPKIKDIKNVITELERDLERELKASAMKREDFDFAKKKKDPIVMNLLKQNIVLIYGNPNTLL
ncbi:TPA: hypothetical protein DEP90_02720 [Patescibacteria group bacterium]|nr:hypothetical protein [Patescibacteria group bacterium]